MTDRELLEKAARAAGLRVIVDGDRLANPHPMYEEKPGTTWNPIEDDGDALRLAVACGLTVCTDGATTVSVCDYQIQGGVFVTQRLDECDGDKDAATRRAIVRAAAAMADDQ